MAKCSEITDINNIISNLSESYLYADGIETDEQFRSLSLQIKQKILNDYVHSKQFKEIYGSLPDVVVKTQEYISSVFLDPEDEYSMLVIPTEEEIQAALSDSNEFETTFTSDKDDNTTSRIELDNEGRIIRRHLSDKFMTKAFGNAYETKKYVENFGTLGILSSAIIDRRHGRPIRNIDDVNSNLRSFQEELFQNILAYATYIGESPSITTLYTKDGPTRGLQNLRGFISNYLTSSIFTPNILNKIYSQIQSRKVSKGNELAYNAYISLVLLNNFDAFIQNYFGENIEINERYIGKRTLENKYRLGSKGTNMNQTWRTSSEIFVVDEIDGITKALINTTPRYAYNSNTPLMDVYLTYPQFLTQICKIKDLMHSTTPDFTIDTTAIDKDGNNIWKLSNKTKQFVKGKSFKELIALTSSSQAEKAWIAIFEILSNPKNPKQELLSQFNQDDLSIIQSIHKGIFSKENPMSIASIMERYPNMNQDYLEYIVQNATSVFPVKFIQYLKDSNGIYARNIQDQAQSRARRNIEVAINTQNSKARIQLEGDYNPDLYGIKPLDARKYELEIDPLAQHPEYKGLYKCKLSLQNEQSILSKPTSFIKEDYERLKDFFSDILSLNLSDAKFEQALFAQYLILEGVDYDSLVNDLYDMSMRILGNQWLSNVVLKNNSTKSSIYNTLISKGYFTKEKAPRFNESLEEINLFNSAADYPKLEKLSAAWIISRLNSSFIQIQDGEGNTSSTSTLSNLQSNYRVQWYEQIKRNPSAAAYGFSIIRDQFVQLYRQKELHDQEAGSTKQVTDFNFAEYINSSLVQNFLDGLIDYNKQRKRISDSIYPIKNGKVGILPSVNSDKPFVGVLVTNLNQLIDPYEMDPDNLMTWREILENSPEAYKDILFDEIIRPEIGGFYKIAVLNINNTLARAFKVAGVPQEVIDRTSCQDFSEINYWARSNNINLPQLLFNATNEYNNTPEGRVNPIELIDQVHFITNGSQLAVNVTLLGQLYLHNNRELFDRFLEVKESQLFKDLIKNNTKIYSDSFSPEQYAQYKKLAPGEWEKNGQLILGKFIYDNVEYDLISTRDLMQLQKKFEFPVDIVKNPDQLARYGEIQLNPLISKYNLLDYTITTEWNFSTVGAYYAHPSKAKIGKTDVFLEEDLFEDDIATYPKELEWDAASRTDASYKRNVSYTASQHIFLTNTLNGIPDTYNVAVIEDLVDTVYNITGDTDSVSPTDGGMFVNPFVVHLENNSLKGERVGINKKQFCHAYSTETGTQIVIKTAGFGITNETMRMSEFDQQLMRKMTKRNWISKTGQPLDINILASNLTYPNSSDYYFKRNGKYYKIFLNDCERTGTNTYNRLIQEVDKHGTPIGPAIDEEWTVQSNYDLWEFFGGMNSMQLNDGTLEWSEASILAVVSAMNNIAVNAAGEQIPVFKGCYQPLKHSDIHYACGAGSVKCGAANINPKSAFDVDHEDFNADTPLNFMRIKVNQLGIQLDKEHQATGEELSLMTQVISSCISRGYTLEQAINMYAGLAQLSKQETKNFSNAKTKNALEEVIVATILGQASKSSLNNSALENLIAPLLDKKERGETVTLQDIQQLGIPYSDNSVYNKIISMCSVELTRKGIKAKIDGLLAVLCPSHNRVKLYGDRLLSSWDNEENLPKNEDGSILTLEQEQHNPKYIIYNGASTDNIVNIQMGRAYQLRLADGRSELIEIIVPKDYHILKNRIRRGEVTGVVEYILNGRNLGEFNCRFIDSENRRWQLYDFKSTMDLFDLKQIQKLNPEAIGIILNPELHTEENLIALNKKLGVENHTWEDLIELVNNGVSILNQNFGTSYAVQHLISPEIFELFSRKDLPVLLRRKVQQDLSSVQNGGEIQLYNGQVVQTDGSNKEIQAAEVVMPKKFADEFGLRKTDDLSTIANDQDFFTTRILENLNISPTMSAIPQNWNVAFKNINGKHVYVLSRNNLPNTTGLSLKDNVHTITDSSGNIIRLGPSYKEMYSMSSDQDVIYEDDYGNEVIVTDDIHYYMDNLQYTNIEISENTATRPGANYDSQFKDIIDYMSDSDNDVAKELYNYFVLQETVDPTTRQVIPGEDLETLDIQNLIQTNKDINSIQTLKTSSMFRHIQKQGREIHTSFLRSLDIVAARIPAQSMQSFMPMKIAAFVESDVNNAYVSTDQIWLQGSDYDIDAVSLAMFSINKMGKYQKWSPYMNLDTIELLKESERLPLPTGISTKIDKSYPTIDMSRYIGTLFRVSKKHIQIIPSQVSLLVDFLNEVNELGSQINIDWGKTKFSKELNEAMIKLIDKHNLFLNNTKSKAAKDNAVKNYNMSKMYEIAASPINLIEASQSVDNTTGEPKAIANTSEVALEQHTHTYGNFANKALAIIENQVGKKCVGISANGLKGFFALTQYYNIILNDPSLSDEEKWKRLGFSKNIATFDRQNPQITQQWHKQLLANVVKYSPTGNQQLAKALEQIDQDTDAAIILSAILSLATDNAKELSLAKLNAGVNMLGIYIYGTMIGIDFKGLSNIMMSTPALIIRDLMEGNSFGIDLKMNKLDQVFDYIELGPTKQLRALNKAIKITQSNQFEVIYISAIVEEAIRKAFGDYKIEQETFANYLAKLAKEYPSDLANKLNVLEQIKSVLYKKYQGNGAWQITRMIDFIQDYLIQVNSVIGSYEAQVNYDSLKKLAYGAMEIRILGQELALNQGLPSSPTDLTSKIQQIEQVINTAIRAKRKIKKRDTFFKSGEFPRMRKAKDASFSLIQFVQDPNYRENMINSYNSVKDSFNILDVLATDPQYFEYLSRLADAYRISSFTLKTRALLRGSELAIQEQEAYDLRDIQDITKAVQNLINKHLINSWLLSTEYGKFVLPAGQYLYTRDYKGRLKRSPNKTTSPKTIQLGTQEGNDTFIMYMETYVIPRVKAGKNKSNKTEPLFKENQFIQQLKALTFNQLNPDRSPRMGYSLPINMMPRTPDEINELETLKESLYKLTGSEYSFGDYNLFNLFYLYNMLAFENRRSESTLASLFDQTSQDISKSKNEFTRNQDLNGEILFEDGKKVTKSHADISKAELIEATRLIRNPYSTELKHIYASDPYEFGYQPYDKKEKVQFSEEEIESGAAEEYYSLMANEEEFGGTTDKGDYERKNKVVIKDRQQTVTIGGARITHKNRIISSITINGKKVTIPGYTKLITTQYQEGSATIYVIDQQSNLDIIENYKNNCRK